MKRRGMTQRRGTDSPESKYLNPTAAGFGERFSLRNMLGGGGISREGRSRSPELGTVQPTRLNQHVYSLRCPLFTWFSRTTPNKLTG